MEEDLLCENCKCEIIEENFIEEEKVDSLYHDLNNGHTYTDYDHIPSGHSFDYYERSLVTYECPDCNKTNTGYIDRFIDTGETE